jgi:hypothetical protein
MAGKASEASTWHRVLEEHEDGINHTRILPSKGRIALDMAVNGIKFDLFAI